MSASKLVAAALVTTALAASLPAEAGDWRNIRQEHRGNRYFGINAWEFPALHDTMRAIQGRGVPLAFNAQVGFGIDYHVSNRTLWLANNGFAGFYVGFAGREFAHANYHYLAQARVDDIDGRLVPRATLHSWTPAAGYQTLFDSAESQPGREVPGYSTTGMPCQLFLAETRSFGISTARGWITVEGNLTGEACRGTNLYATVLSGLNAEVNAKPQVAVYFRSAIAGVTAFGHADLSGDAEGRLHARVGDIRGNQVCASTNGFAEVYGIGRTSLALVPFLQLVDVRGLDLPRPVFQTSDCRDLW